MSARGRDAGRARTIAAAGTYAAFLFAIYLVSGPLRAARLDPALGATAGATVEAGLFVPVIMFGGTMIPAVFGLTRKSSGLLLTGVFALAFFLAADGLVAVTLCGLSLGEHLSRFLTPAGWIQGGALLLFAAFPWLWWHNDGAPMRAMGRAA